MLGASLNDRSSAHSSRWRNQTFSNLADPGEIPSTSTRYSRYALVSSQFPLLIIRYAFFSQQCVPVLRPQVGQSQSTYTNRPS